MKIVFLTPTHQSHARGNTVTVNRWCQGLASLGHETTILENDQESRLESLAPNIIHAHHAVHCGPTAIRARSTVPDAKVVISLGGTDLHGPQGGPQHSGRHALSQADAIVGPFAEDGEKLFKAFPECKNFHVVPRGVALSDLAPMPLELPLRGVMIGGIRKVKGPLAALDWRVRTENHGTTMMLDFAGPIIEEEYGAQFLAACQQDRRAQYLGQLNPSEVKDLTESSDFLLNFSESEGASNAILEALASGRPVAARKVAGNTQLLQHAPQSIAHLIETSDKGFESWFSWLNKLSNQCPEELMKTAKAFVTSNYSCDSEIKALLKVYEGLL